MKLAELLEAYIHNSALVTFLVSLVPVIELRGAIPIGVAMGMRPLAAMLVSIVGNLVPVPFIVLFIRRIFGWMRRHLPWLGRLVSRLEAKGEKHRDKVEKGQFWGLFILVAIPLPGTGAWTGALVAALMDLRLKRAFPAIALGVVAAGLVVTLITVGVKGLTP